MALKSGNWPFKGSDIFERIEQTGGMNIRFTLVIKYLFLDGSPFASNSHTSSEVSTLFSLSRFGYTIPFRLKEECKTLDLMTMSLLFPCAFDFMMALRSTRTHNITLKNLALLMPKLRDYLSTNQIARFVNYYCHRVNRIKFSIWSKNWKHSHEIDIRSRDSIIPALMIAEKRAICFSIIHYEMKMSKMTSFINWIEPPSLRFWVCTQARSLHNFIIVCLCSLGKKREEQMALKCNAFILSMDQRKLWKN